MKARAPLLPAASAGSAAATEGAAHMNADSKQRADYRLQRLQTTTTRRLIPETSTNWYISTQHEEEEATSLIIHPVSQSVVCLLPSYYIKL